MTLKKLIQSNTWPSVATTFLEIYPEAENNIKGYEQVFEKLTEMQPEKIDMTIVISIENGTADDDQYIEVTGLYNNPKSDDEHYSQGIELTPWREWLGMDISKESLNNFSQQEILVHCLYEMTFAGFSEEEIEKTTNEMEKNSSNTDSLPEEREYVSEESIEALLKEWENEKGEK